LKFPHAREVTDLDGSLSSGKHKHGFVQMFHKVFLPAYKRNLIGTVGGIMFASGITCVYFTSSAWQQSAT
jgi:hypothetical protein